MQVFLINNSTQQPHTKSGHDVALIVRSTLASPNSSVNTAFSGLPSTNNVLPTRYLSKSCPFNNDWNMNTEYHTDPPFPFGLSTTTDNFAYLFGSSSSPYNSIAPNFPAICTLAFPLGPNCGLGGNNSGHDIAFNI